jgi:hypothetical protein
MTPASFPVGMDQWLPVPAKVETILVYFGVQLHLCCFPYGLVHASGFAGQDVGF